MFDFTKNRLHYIKGGKYPHCHSLFIDDEKRVLIDPACSVNILKSFTDERRINIIINTHCHEDHFLNNYLFPEAELWAHEAESGMFEDMECLLDAWLTPEQKQGPIGEESRNFLQDVAHYIPRKPDRLLEDSEIIVFGETRMQVLHTPGHSPGHLCFYFPDDKVLYTADLDLVKAGPYYGDKGSDIDDTINSLERIMTIDAEFYLSAHGKYGIYEADPGLVQAYLEVIHTRESRLVEALQDSPLTLEQIARLGIIYGKRTNADIWFIENSERNMMLKHLERLKKNGNVAKEGETWHLVRSAS